MAESYGQVWISIIVHGFILFPWHVLKFILGGFQSKTLCLPVKRNCSMNGRQGGAAAPFAIEALAFIVTAVAFVMYYGANAPHVPIAYADASKLLAADANAPAPHTNKAPLRAAADYPAAVGIMEDEFVKRHTDGGFGEAQLFTLLDKASVTEMVAACNAMSATYGTDSGLDNKPTAHCDLITFSEKCVCAGGNAAAHSPCHGKSTYYNKLDGTANAEGAGVCRAHSGLGNYIDTKNLANKKEGNTCLFMMAALFMSFMRLLAYALFKDELRKPGSQWVNGWWAGIAAIAATSGINNMKNWLANSAGQNYFADDFTVFGYNPSKTWATVHPYNTTKVVGDWNNICIVVTLAAILNICCSFFSTESYCNDCTGYAYTKENLTRMNRRVKK